MASQGSQSGMATQTWFLRLPTEICLLIVSFLPSKDVKSLRLTCKQLGEITPFSSSRVFLSANSLNIQVFRAIADHPKFRQQITEIIWDDASFASAALIWEGEPPIIDPQSLQINPKEGCPNWFVDECEENRYMIRHRKYRDVDRPDHVARKNQLDAQMPLKACWEYYLQVLNDQKAVIESQEDEKAFLYGLERFPRLKRVTVTPAAHGWLFAPLYDTPMIRAFPYGLNYPIPRGWHFDSCDGRTPNPLPWSETTEKYKELWRGARIVLRVLSQVKKHAVSELSFDSKLLDTGINYMIFERPCEEYDYFAAIMKRPGFRRLHLSLLTSTSGVHDLRGFRSGYFYQAISLAKELTHIYLSTTSDDGSACSMLSPPIPLKKIFPIEEWPNLCYLGVSRFSVNTSELIDILNSVPASFRSVELQFLVFPCDKFHFSGLLKRMREELNWTERYQPLNATVAIAMEGRRGGPGGSAGRFIELTHEVTNFLYGSGEIPVDEKDIRAPKSGMGMCHDLFEVEYTRPNVSFKELAKLGIIRS